MHRHDEAVFADGVFTAGQMAEFAWDRNDPIAMAEVAFSRGLSDRLICLDIAKLAFSAGMSLAKLPFHGGSVAAINRANVVHATPYRSVGQYVAEPQQAE